MRNIIQIIIKNLKLLMRSRTSALIIILAPLMLILLVGVAFDNSNSFGLTIGVHSKSFGENIEGLLTKLTQQDFKIIKYEDEQSCTDDIKLGVINTCIVFPSDLVFESNEQKEVTFYVDYSKINLVWMIMDTLNAHFGTSAREISKNLVKVLVDKLESSKAELESKKPLVAQLRTRTGDVSSKAQSVSGDLTSLNLNYDDGSIPIGNATSMLDLLNSNLTSKLNAAKGHIETAQAINHSDTASALEDAIGDVVDAKYLVTAANSPSLTKLDTMLDTIKINLEIIKAEMAKANELKQTATPKLNDIKSGLDQSLNDISDVEASFDAIVNEINAIKVTNPEAIAQPFVTNIKPVAAQSTYLNYLFPSLIILVIMFISILLSTTLVMMEKHSPAYFRNFITPTRDIAFVVATFLTSMILVLMQVGIILFIAGYFFSAQILPSLHLIIGILVLAAMFFTFWGMTIGYTFTSEETATLAAISSGSVFLFISSVIIPLESMPLAIRQVVSFNPFVIAERLLRQTILFQPNIQALANDLITIAAYSVALFVFILAFQKVMNKHFMQKITYYQHKRRRAEEVRRKTEPKEEWKKESGKHSVSFGLFVKKTEKKPEEKGENKEVKKDKKKDKLVKQKEELERKLNELNQSLKK